MTHLPILPIVIPLLAVPAVFFGHRFELVDGRKVLALVSALGLAVFAGLAVALARSGTLPYAVGGWPFGRGILLIADPLSLLMLGMVQLIFLAAVLFPFPREPEARAAYCTFLCLLQAGLNGMILTADLFNLYVALEITSIVSYALVAYPKNRESLEAGFKYLLLGSVGSLLILWGIGLVYASTGSLNLAHLSRVFGELPHPVRSAVLALLFTGFAMKFALVPFHTWKPDAYGSAPAPVSAILAGVGSKVPLYCLLRIVSLLFAGMFRAGPGGFGSLLVWAGFASIAVGHFMALRQVRLGRLLAYSSVAHIGYIVVALGSASADSVAAGLFHLVNHGILKAGLFLLTGCLVTLRGSDRLDAMRGMSRDAPGLVALFALFSLGMVGVPPVNGFVSKWAVLTSVMRAGHPVQAAAVAAGGLVALLYYARVVGLMCLPLRAGPTAPAGPALQALRWDARVSLALLAVFCVALFFLGGPALRLLSGVSGIVVAPQDYVQAILAGAGP